MGGTFGCIGSPLSPMPQAQFLPRLQSIIPEALTDQIQVYAAPDIVDSSACTAQVWLRLVQMIQQQHKQHHIEKFVIIHGTDTLSYASAVLSRFLAKTCTVVLTGSQYPLLAPSATHIRPDSDALNNLIFALEQIQTQPQGVYLAFDQYIYHAQSALKYHTTARHAFRGINANTTIENISTTVAHDVNSDDIHRAQSLNIINLMLQPIEQDQLAQSLQNISQQPPDFLILQGFGIGNIATNSHIISLLKQLKQQGCLPILTTQVTFGPIDQRYAVSQWIKDAEIIVADTISHADLYAKILKLYLTYNDINQYQHHWFDSL